MEGREIHWNNQLEDLIASEAEACRGYAWIHLQAEALYTKKNNAISIPVIILSTLAGTASVGSSSLFDGETKTSSIAIGLVSILVGILNTIQSYFAFSRKAEAHRISHITYSKLFTTVRVELSLPREERQAPTELLQTLRDNMQRLAETTPSPPQNILDDFNKHFKNEDQSISRPTETNGLKKITVYRDNPLTQNRSISIDVRTPRQLQTGEEGGSHQTASTPSRDQNGIRPQSPGRTSSENQGSLPGQEASAKEV